MTNVLRKIVKHLQFCTPLRKLMVHRYDYFFWPSELAFLCETMAKAVGTEGIVLEIGCAQGATTILLNKHLDWSARYNGLRKGIPYVCIDTFSGFVREQIAYERNELNKTSYSYNDYQVNSPKWFRYMLELNGYPNVEVNKSDVAKFDWSMIDSIGFCLLDVDLYLPIRSALPEVYKRLTPNGVIVVDDCQPSQQYDGARQAYLEFIQEMNLEPEFHHRKFGVVRAPSRTPSK